jgi:hypothetical protein
MGGSERRKMEGGEDGKMEEMEGEKEGEMGREEGRL